MFAMFLIEAIQRFLSYPVSNFHLAYHSEHIDEDQRWEAKTSN